MHNNIEKYRDILFSFLHRDQEYPAVIKSKGFTLKKTLRVFYRSIKHEISDAFLSNDVSINNKVWLFSESDNQFKALQPLAKIPDFVLVTSSDKLYSRYKNSLIIKLSLPTKLKNRIYRIIFFHHYKKTFGVKFKDHLSTIIKYDGIYESLLVLLKKHTPKAIVFSNDHNAYCRAMLIVAKDMGIKTVYVQHAAVTDRFPPLKFDLSLLEGQDSLDKYRRAGNIQGEVAMVGMLKFDDYHHLINKNKFVKSIGVALNAGDDFDRYFHVFNAIHQQYPKLCFYIRFHPSIKVKLIDIPDFFKVSLTENQSSFDFLSNIDVLFAGNSSIHLEGIIMNIPSYQIQYSDEILDDYYQFIKNGLVEVIDVTKLTDLIPQLIDNKPKVRWKAKYYNEVIDTEYDGASIQCVKDIIKKLVNE